MQHLRQVQFETTSTDAVDNYIWICNQYVVTLSMQYSKSKFVGVEECCKNNQNWKYMSSSVCENPNRKRQVHFETNWTDAAD